MEKFIFTFPGNHPLKNYIQPIFAKDVNTARAKMFERYGNKWGFFYTEEKWRQWEKEAKKMGLPMETELNPIYCKEAE